ncbi:glycosyltransferase [Halodesulfovibrio sp.]|jgi:hypothetical protein|uniref:glycosyltransferase n=1 Tax=Halodesulfovibrio sp. TaxID=1912772 RepID=UPI0025D90420|nr:glycosyltransferase [Halodesulfovibrio sp.]MCT4535549.1 glycosyltransferase [Halodesulfovibrio sp.]
MPVIQPEYAPIALFVYNRVDHTQQTVDHLRKNFLATQSDLFVFCDGARSQDTDTVAAVRKYIYSISGFKSITIIERDINVGLAASIVEGVSDVVNQYGSVIVLEDDLVTSPHFLTYMNTCLGKYENFPEVFSIAGWSPPTLTKVESEYSIAFLPRNCSWGWATWKDRWNTVDWDVSDYDEFKHSPLRQKEFNRGGVDLSNMLKAQMNGEINSWAIVFCYSQFTQNKRTVFPLRSYVENIGCDGSGVHCDVEISQQPIESHERELVLPEAVYEDESALALFAAFYRPAPFIIRAINKLARTVIGKNIIRYETTPS